MEIGEWVNLRHLQAIAEIVRHRSVRRAALAINLSQPAVTQAVGQIERALQRRLFERSGSGMIAGAATLQLAAHIDRGFAWLMMADRLLGANVPLHRNVTRVQLQSLIAAAQSDSISLAARRMGVRQPSVTRALRDLETLCGRALFIRSPQGSDATREARELARFAGLAFAEFQQGFDLFHEFYGRIDGRIIIGSLPLARSFLVPSAVTRLMQRHPAVRPKIIDGPYEELLQGLRAGQIDCIIGALRAPAPPDIRQEPLFEDCLSIVVRPDHPMRSLRTLSRQDYAALDWILPPEGTPAREMFRAFFAAMGLELPTGFIECSSLIAVRSLLLQSDRAALLSATQIPYELQSGQLALLGGKLPQTRRPIGLSLRSDWRATRAQHDFLLFLREIVAETITPDYP